MQPEESSTKNIEVAQLKSAAVENSSTTPSHGDQILLVVARLMEGGQEDEDTCQTLDKLTKLLSEEQCSATPDQDTPSLLHKLIDADGFETVLGYLDMRQGPMVRGHATLTVSAYLKASGQRGIEYLSEFFKSRISKGTYDDFIVAFSVAASIFPIVPDVSQDLFLSEGFVNSLGSLMKRKWKSKKVEQACLEMLNAACMRTACREAIQMHCMVWLEEIVVETPIHPQVATSPERYEVIEDGPLEKYVHSGKVGNLAAVILAKLQAVPSISEISSNSRIQPVSTSIEDLSERFTNMFGEDKDDLSQQLSIEGLAYASLRPPVKERLASDHTFLKDLLNAMKKEEPKSPTTYGGLTILDNLTKAVPKLTEDQKRMAQLKAYSNASKASFERDPLDDEEHLKNRRNAVFEAGAIPLLVTHSHHGSVASVRQIVSIIFSLSEMKPLRGQMIQQGAIKLVLWAYSTFPKEQMEVRRTAAHALARLLISVNPELAFGNSSPPIHSAIEPVATLLGDDPNRDHRDLLQIFEALLALTNLASTDDSVRNPMIRLVFPKLDEFFFENNLLIVRATAELICNLVQSDQGVAAFADGKAQSHARMRLLMALGDCEDMAARRAVAGALATMTQWDAATNWIIDKEIGNFANLFAFLIEDYEDIRYRGIVIILNLLDHSEKYGDWGLNKLKKAGAYETVKKGLMKAESKDVVALYNEVLKKLMD